MYIPFVSPSTPRSVSTPMPLAPRGWLARLGDRYFPDSHKVREEILAKAAVQQGMANWRYVSISSLHNTSIDIGTHIYTLAYTLHLPCTWDGRSIGSSALTLARVTRRLFYR